jgi:acyl-CoA synthetase (AMP-forming)/AMP-acid ligase II
MRPRTTRWRTLPGALRSWAKARPGAPALTCGDAELDYRELDRAVTAACRLLAGAGATARQRVVIAGPNGTDWVVAFLACLRLGAVAVPLNIRLSPLELRRQLEVCAPALILAAEPVLPAIERALPAAAPRVLALERQADSGRSFWRLPSAGLPHSAPRAAAPALISFTSGSTGAPRGALISHRALVRSASSFVPRLETTSDDTTSTLVPLFHNTGFVDQLAQMLLVGGAVDLLPEFHTGAAIHALAHRPASYLIAVPSIVRLLMLHDRADEAFRGCRVLVYGGASMPAAWIRELAERWPALRLFNCYGLTEFTSVSHLLDPEDALERAESVGRPVEGVRQKIVGADGEPGEIRLAGPMRMDGYWRDDAATREALRGPWLRTGDLGTIDDGFLTVVGHSAEVVNRGGEKIHVRSIEAALGELADVAEAAVVGAAHPILQERVVAFVVPRRGREFDEPTAREHLAERVADYAIPERFVVVDELPRSGAGKVDRVRLRAEAEA